MTLSLWVPPCFLLACDSWSTLMGVNFKRTTYIIYYNGKANVRVRSKTDIQGVKSEKNLNNLERDRLFTYWIVDVIADILLQRKLSILKVWI